MKLGEDSLTALSSHLEVRVSGQRDLVAEGAGVALLRLLGARAVDADLERGRAGAGGRGRAAGAAHRAPRPPQPLALLRLQAQIPPHLQRGVS